MNTVIDLMEAYAVRYNEHSVCVTSKDVVSCVFLDNVDGVPEYGYYHNGVEINRDRASNLVAGLVER